MIMHSCNKFFCAGRFYNVACKFSRLCFQGERPGQDYQHESVVLAPRYAGATCRYARACTKDPDAR